jgi:hypothetical protein
MNAGSRARWVTLAVVCTGLALLGHAPVGGHFAPDVLPGGFLLGIGAGTALAPLLLAATGDLPPSDSGLASGIASTSFMLGGALGLAALAAARWLRPATPSAGTVSRPVVEPALIAPASQ